MLFTYLDFFERKILNIALSLRCLHHPWTQDISVLLMYFVNRGNCTPLQCVSISNLRSRQYKDVLRISRTYTCIVN
jgi:hypothetical protein